MVHAIFIIIFVLLLPMSFRILFIFYHLQKIEKERYKDQLRRLNIDLGRQNSTGLVVEGERYKNGTTEPIPEIWNGTEVVNAL